MAEATPVPRSERVAAAIKDALAQDSAQKGGSEPAPAAAPVKAEAPAEKKSVEDRSFERLTKEAAALRQKGEKYKSYETLETKLPPGSLDALAKAKLANDPEAALVALGWTYADVAERQLEKKPPAPEGKEPEKGKAEIPPEVAEALAEVKELKAEREMAKAKAVEAEARGKIKDFVKDKFPLISGLERENLVADYLIDFYRKTGGQSPGETWEESMELAAIAVEKNLSAEKAKWEKILGQKVDSGGKSPTLDGEAQDASAGAGSPGKTLTNELSSGGQKPTPKTRAEILKSLENDPRAWSSD